MVGGYLSIKRCATSIPFDTFVTDDQVGRERRGGGEGRVMTSAVF